MKKTMLKIAVAAAFALPVSSQALVHVFQANLTGDQEVPSVTSPGVGAATLIFDDITNMFTLSMGGGGLLSTIRDAHIHSAPPGVAGPVIVPLFGLPEFIGAGETFFVMTLGPTLFPVDNVAPGVDTLNKDALLAGNTYINIHTNLPAGVPSGEIRGQLISQLIAVPIPEPETYALMLAGLGLVGWVAARRRKVGV